MKNLFRVAFILLLTAATAAAQETIDWTRQADGLRGRDGQRFAFVCPPNGTVSARVWGTDLYTDDSSICSAAVHAGLITPGGGGAVTIEVRAGASSYAASTRHGVTSRGYGGWHGSFVFVAGGGGGNPPVITIDWITQADGLRGRNGQRFTYDCPAGGTPSSRVWGTDVYTDDSSICTCAVHAGLITARAGGVVTIEIRPGASSYEATTKNGITSRAYGGWHGSFVFVRP